MRKYDVDISSILINGSVITEMKNGVLNVSTTKRLSTKFEDKNMTLNSYVYTPDTYRLPLRIDL